MNERIEELKRQASLWCDMNIPEQFSEEINGYGSACFEKFAELIVRECIAQLEIGKSCDPYTGELFSCDRNNNIDYEIAVLKEHFGVQ